MRPILLRGTRVHPERVLSQDRAVGLCVPGLVLIHARASASYALATARLLMRVTLEQYIEDEKEENKGQEKE